MSELVDLKICGLTLPEAKEILKKVREVEQRNTDRTYFVQLLGLEHNSLRDAEEVLREVFPTVNILKETLSYASPRFTILSGNKVEE